MSRGSKKSAAVRRTSHASRGAVRGGAPAAKLAGTRKGAGEGVVPGMTSNKKTTQRQGFKTNEFIVYPAHGVGQIMAIEEQEVAGAKLELFVINFVKDKMTYNKVRVTYDAYCEIINGLTEAEKVRITELLIEAREEAMDGGSAEEKTAVFQKCKGKINNYLSKQGIHPEKQNAATVKTNSVPK